jgi:hypothetical protein
VRVPRDPSTTTLLTLSLSGAASAVADLRQGFRKAWRPRPLTSEFEPTGVENTREGPEPSSTATRRSLP